jgi:hypothetical protein
VKYENTLFWRYDPAALVPVARDASGEERGALSEILRCLPREVGQIRSRFDGATDAGTALMNGSLALTRHLNNLLNSWYLGATLADSVSGLVERKLVGFIHAPTLSYGKEVEGLRTLLAAHAAAGDSCLAGVHRHGGHDAPDGMWAVQARREDDWRDAG